jgi:hypothetical protein
MATKRLVVTRDGMDVVEGPAIGSDGVPILTEKEFRRFDAALQWYERLAKLSLDYYEVRSKPADDASAVQRVAWTILECARGMRLRWKQGKAREAVAFAFQLGMNCQRLVTLDNEGLGNREMTRKMNITDDKNERRDKAVRMYRKLRSKHAKKENVVKAIAQETGWSERVIWNYLKGIRP